LAGAALSVIPWNGDALVAVTSDNARKRERKFKKKNKESEEGKIKDISERVYRS
jgi:hypothetical protein